MGEMTSDDLTGNLKTERERLGKLTGVVRVGRMREGILISFDFLILNRP